MTARAADPVNTRLARVTRLREAAEQALWHMGNDADRNAMVEAGRGWKTSADECADMLRASIAEGHML